MSTAFNYFSCSVASKINRKSQRYQPRVHSAGPLKESVATHISRNWIRPSFFCGLQPSLRCCCVSGRPFLCVFLSYQMLIHSPNMVAGENSSALLKQVFSLPSFWRCCLDSSKTLLPGVLPSRQGNRAANQTLASGGNRRAALHHSPKSRGTALTPNPPAKEGWGASSAPDLPRKPCRQSGNPFTTDNLPERTRLRQNPTPAKSHPRRPARPARKVLLFR